PDDDAVFDIEAAKNIIIQDRVKTSPPKSPSKPTVEPWRERFAALRSAITPPAAGIGQTDRRLLYFIDSAEQSGRKGLMLLARVFESEEERRVGKAIHLREVDTRSAFARCQRSKHP